jgi:hypothetical protein
LQKMRKIEGERERVRDEEKEGERMGDRKRLR